MEAIKIDSKTFYYARVSSKEQNLDRQIEAFIKIGADEREIICDKESGKDLDRSGYKALKNTILNILRRKYRISCLRKI